MPKYTYRCTNNHEITLDKHGQEGKQCTECDSVLERVYTPVLVGFKGGGWSRRTDLPDKNYMKTRYGRGADK